MKKILSISVLLVFASTTIANSAEQFSLSSYLNKQVSKVEQKENEINAKLEAQRKENEAKMAEREKKQLVEDNISLKQEVRNLKTKIEVLTESDISGNISNADVLRRISKLEKIIYGKE